MTAPATEPDAEELPAPRSFYDVPGWLYNTDVVLFDWFLRRQESAGRHGDLLEMGAYMGKSAVLMRAYLRGDETFTVCDLFDSDAPDEHNERETRGSYATLTRRAFEANYLSFHDELPRILQAPTSVVPDEVAAGSCRFVHVDASHLYEHVYPDIGNARKVLCPDGLVVLDDYRSSHTPGVACATWQAVLEDGLRPVCVTNNKFYGMWDDPGPDQDRLHEELAARGDCWLQWQQVAGHRLLLVGGKKATPPVLPVSRHAKRPKPAGATAEQAAEQTAAGGPGTGKPAADGRTGHKPAGQGTAPAKAAGRNPATGKPAGDGPAGRKQAVRQPAAKKSAGQKPATKQAAPRPARPPRSLLRRVAVDVLPPVLTRAVVRARKRRRGR